MYHIKLPSSLPPHAFLPRAQERISGRIRLAMHLQNASEPETNSRQFETVLWVVGARSSSFARQFSRDSQMKSLLRNYARKDHERAKSHRYKLPEVSFLLPEACASMQFDLREFFVQRKNCILTTFGFFRCFGPWCDGSSPLFCGRLSRCGSCSCFPPEEFLISWSQQGESRHKCWILIYSYALTLGKKLHRKTEPAENRTTGTENFCASLWQL